MSSLNNFLHYVPAMFVLGSVMCRILKMDYRKTKFYVFALYFGLAVCTAYALFLPASVGLVASLCLVLVVLLSSTKGWTTKQPPYTVRKEKL